MLGSFRYNTRSWIRALIHSNKVVTVKTLFFRRVFRAHLNVGSFAISGLSWGYGFQNFTLIRDVLHVHGTLLFHWVCRIDVNHVLQVFSDIPVLLSGEFTHPHEVVTSKFFLFRLVVSTDFLGILKD